MRVLKKAALTTNIATFILYPYLVTKDKTSFCFALGDPLRIFLTSVFWSAIIVAYSSLPLFFIADCTYTGFVFMLYFWIFLHQFWFVLILFRLRYFISIVLSRKQHARCLISIAFRLYIFYINMIIYFLNNVFVTVIATK